jgi:2-oxo-4-hydroxy-4-carboxy-5-ureidoimidazoline decarboxylase
MPRKRAKLISNMTTAASSKLSLARVNAMSPEEFSRSFGAVYEHSPWIAQRALARRPFASLAALHTAMRDTVVAATRDEQLALLRAHPELAGRAAKAGELTAHSSAEQRGAGLNALSPAEMARITELNRAHAEKFGFPFIIAVRLAAKPVILAEFERRLALNADEEMRLCLEQVFLITGLRLRDLFEE